MENQFEKTFYAGLGLALRTKDAIADMAQRLAQEQQLNEAEGRRLSDSLVQQAEDFRDRLSKLVEKQVNASLKQLNVVQKSEYDALQARVRALEERLAKADSQS